jgi:hypothetical protein
MGLRRQFKTSTALPQGNKEIVPGAYLKKAQWAQVPAWTVCWEDRKLSLLGIERRFLGRPIRSLFTISNSTVSVTNM